MRKPSVTFDALFAALAVLATSTACSKADRAAAEPPAAAPAATATGTAAPGKAGDGKRADDNAAAPPPAPLTPTTPAPQAGAMQAVDAGIEKPRAAPTTTKGASAACGATGCSADMRKGGK